MPSVDAATVEATNRQGVWLLTRWAADGNADRLLEVVAEERIRLELRIWMISRFPGFRRDEFGDGQVFVAALVAALSDSNPWVRRDAARAVYGAPKKWDLRKTAAALRSLLADENDLVRLEAAIALSGIGDQAARAPLIEFAETGATNQQRSAVAALARLRTPEGEKWMCGYLTGPESDWAAGWLAEMGTASSIAPLKRARRRNPFSRRDYTAAITAIKRRKAEQA